MQYKSGTAAWKSRTYTDGSCLIKEGGQVIGADVFHPSSGNSTSCLVELNDADKVSTIGRVELAAVAASFAHGHAKLPAMSVQTPLPSTKPTSLCPEYGSPVSSHPISGTIPSCGGQKISGLGASSKPLTTSTASSVKAFAKLWPMLASTLSSGRLLGVGGATYSPYILEPLKHLGLHPQKDTKLS